jgi:hypothetical protein
MSRTTGAISGTGSATLPKHSGLINCFVIFILPEKAFRETPNPPGEILDFKKSFGSRTSKKRRKIQWSNVKRPFF